MLVAQVDRSVLSRGQQGDVTLRLKVDTWSPPVEYLGKVSSSPVTAPASSVPPVSEPAAAIPDESSSVPTAAEKAAEATSAESAQRPAGTWYAPTAAQPYALLVAILALLLGGTALMLPLIRQRTASRKHRSDQNWATTEDIERVSEAAIEAKRTAGEAIRRVSENSSLVSIADINKRWEDLNSKIRIISTQMEMPEQQPPTEPPVLQGDMQVVAEALRSSELSKMRLRGSGGTAPSNTEGLALAAVVNRWIEEGGKDRSKLLSLANDAGIGSVWLANLDNALTPQVGDRFECSFRRSDDGSWLWMQVPGTQEFWAAPADAQLMGMGSTPYQLDRMFDGMQGAKQAFRFDAVYRPCRLGSHGGRYFLINRGALKLEGLPAPNVPRPQTLTAYRYQPQAAILGDSSADLGRMLAGWIRSIENQVRDYGVEIGQLQEGATAPRTSDMTSRAEIETLKQLLYGLHRDIDVLRGQVGELDAEFAVRIPAAVSQSTPMSGAAATVERSDSSTRLQVTDADRPPQPAKPFLSVIVPESMVSEASPAASSGVSEPEDALGAQRSNPDDAKVQPELPLRWEEALLAARNRLDSDPEMIDVPSQELYTQRVRNLRDSLHDMNPTAEFAIIHVKKDSGSSTVELHETEESGTGDILCRKCCARHTWQLAVSCGVPPAATVYVLYPASTLGKGNFAAGYSALVDRLASSSFSTQSYEPAQLKLQDAQTSTYSVWRKMTLK